MRSTSLPLFICPSDDNFEPIIDIPSKSSTRIICQMAAGNYVASAGTVRPTCKLCRDRFDGVFGRNRAIKPKELLDGLTKTLAVGERASGGRGLSSGAWFRIRKSSTIKSRACMPPVPLTSWEPRSTKGSTSNHRSMTWTTARSARLPNRSAASIRAGHSSCFATPAFALSGTMPTPRS